MARDCATREGMKGWRAKDLIFDKRISNPKRWKVHARLAKKSASRFALGTNQENCDLGKRSINWRKKLCGHGGAYGFERGIHCKHSGDLNECDFWIFKNVLNFFYTRYRHARRILVFG